MTTSRAMPLPAPRPGSARRAAPRRNAGGSLLAASLGLGCGALAALGVLAATTDLPSRFLAAAPAAPSVATTEAPRTRHTAIPRVATPPQVAKPHAAPRVAAVAPVRHRMAPPVVTTWVPAHALALPVLAEVSGFATEEGSLVASAGDTARFVPPPGAAVAVAALDGPAAPAALPAPAASVQMASVVPVAPAADAAPVPETAEEALEAALIPTPSARPYRAPAVTLRTRQVPPPAALAYARPDAGADEPEKPMFGGLFSPKPRAGNGVAVYDIGAATVYMPNGERLEAHSGLGAMRDNPRFVHAKNRGPTPPHTYDLRLRESLFHGVQAIRLTPVGGERRIYNRNGLLAHTYMLGARGDSNGCVSFKDYRRFLAAFRRGEVRRLVVVARMGDPSSRVAALFGR